MKKLTILAILFLSAFGSLAQPGIVAHRGFYKYEGSAENTISALQNTIDHDLYASEFDVRFTSDGVGILYHDAAINGRPIEDARYHDLYANPAFTLKNGETIPPLKDALAIFKKASDEQFASRGTTTRILWEVKMPNRKERRDETIRRTAEMLKDYPLRDLVQLISFDLECCRQLAALLPDVPVAYLGGDVPPAQLKEHGISGIVYHYKVIFAHPEWVKEAHQLGMTVNVWTVNDANDAVSLSNLGVDYITTDLPLDMQHWLHKTVINPDTGEVR